MLRSIFKIEKLPFIRNRQDVRLLNNRILPPYYWKLVGGEYDR